MTRTLRSKRQRALLWYAADGKCQRCGEPLGEDWEADHIVPWKETRRTNVHEMQALCQECNRKKGATVLRQHQIESDALCRDILAGKQINRIYLSVTPGGGKSAIPIIVAARLIPRVIDAICWVAPRRSLQEQAERNFLDPDFRRIIGHAHEIRASTNDINPCRGTSGYCTTYQAIHADPQLHAAEFARKRYALILDEPHHVEDEGPWSKSLRSLVDRARLVFFMTGTWERGDGQRIAFYPYVRQPGGYTLDLPPTSDEMLDYAFIRYTRGMALEERAIKPLRFHPQDGRVEWIDTQGNTRIADSLAATSGDYASEALYTALNTEYAYQILNRTVQEWSGYRTHRPWSKLLIVAKGINEAKSYLKHLHTLGISRADIATSDDSDAARDAINRFKQPSSSIGALDALATVAMAYEGLDVPAVTHIACLTHIRSTPWIEQMATRAARVYRDGGPYEEQTGHIYGPDDPLLHECFAAILAEQEPFVRDRREKPSNGSGDTARNATTQVVPITGVVTRERALDLSTGAGLDYAETARIQSVLQKNGLGGILDPITWKRMFDDYQAAQPAAETTDVPIAPASERERKLRHEIDSYIKRFEGSHQMEWGTVNRAARYHFRKAREEMLENELKQVWTWLNDQYQM